MKAKKIEAYKCLICDELHPGEDDAMYCCEDEKREAVDAWSCGECSCIYEDKEEAKECCK